MVIYLFLHNKWLCVLAWCRLYSVLQVALLHQIKAKPICSESRVHGLTADWWYMLKKPVLFLRCHKNLHNTVSEAETLTWFILTDYQSHFDQIRCDFLSHWSVLPEMRLDYHSRQFRVDCTSFCWHHNIHISSYSPRLQLHQSKHGFLTPVKPHQ